MMLLESKEARRALWRSDDGEKENVSRKLPRRDVDPFLVGIDAIESLPRPSLADVGFCTSAATVGAGTSLNREAKLGRRLDVLSLLLLELVLPS
jgi:hypothetical protein